MSRLVSKIKLPYVGEMYVTNVEEASFECLMSVQEALKKLYDYEQAEEENSDCKEVWLVRERI